VTNGRPAMSVAAGRRMAAPARGRVMPLAPGVVLGIGLGGFLDGILLHQILQWHHMLTSAGYPADSVVNLEINTLFDGLFHAVTWIAVAAGLFLLHRAAVHGAAWSWQRLVGGMAIGWGAFNLVEGVVDHHLLGLHHVKESAMLPGISASSSSGQPSSSGGRCSRAVLIPARPGGFPGPDRSRPGRAWRRVRRASARSDPACPIRRHAPWLADCTSESQGDVRWPSGRWMGRWS
jgi:uncharacterized membrane protein